LAASSLVPTREANTRSLFCQLAPGLNHGDEGRSLHPA
jgi:hypothetical protein